MRGLRSNLAAADLTLRKSANSWFKLQTGRSTGLLSPSLQSNDGGFAFNGPDDQSFTGAKAGAYRADLSVGLRDFFEGHDGSFTFYKQHLDAGYSSPGQATIKDTEQYGGTFRMPVTHSLSLVAKGDQKIEKPGARDPGDRNGRELQADRKMEHQHRRAQRFTQG